MAVKKSDRERDKAAKATKASLDAGAARPKASAKAKAAKPVAAAKKPLKGAAAAKAQTPAVPAPGKAAGAKPAASSGSPRTSPGRPVKERKPAKAAISVRGDEPDAEQDPAARAKLAVGPGAEARETPTQIPWSYGIDRVTAAAVDPERLFVYWEVTDSAIERARGALGRGGPGAWLNLRVYDTTGLIFDGTNAHSYFDHAVDRTTRQWFFHVGKPTSTAFVELGMRSSEGYFARIVRSGRIDFPRREPSPWGDPEWMTVRPWSGEVADLHRSPAPATARVGVGGGGGGSEVGDAYWTTREPGGVHESVLRQLIEGGWERVEWNQSEGEGWYALEGRVEWESPRVVTSWEAGPFAYPVEVEPPQRETRVGHGSAYRVGNVTHVVEGPWRVVIRNIGARTERQIIGTWEIHRSWSVTGGWARRAAAGRAGIGASEQRWISGSEARLGGASELWRIGASELAWRGASERLLAGASQRMLRGASERAWAGASEYRLGGASESAFAGASERAFAGGSERAFAGGSERALGGGSEARAGGSEVRFEGPTTPPLPYPPVDPAGTGRKG